jgi:choline kinase
MLLYEGVEACKVERQIAALRRGGADERLGLAPPGDPRFADPLADAEIFRINAAGQLLEIGGKTTRIEDIEGQYVGLLKFTPSAWSAAEVLLSTLDAQIRDRLDVTGLLHRLLTGKELPMGTFGTDGQWGEIDNPEDVALYQNMVKEG